MVVLVSFLLVLAAAVTLVVGLLQSGLTLIYLSIGCSVVAGLVLAVAVLRGRPEPKAAPYAAPPRPVSTRRRRRCRATPPGSRASRSRPTSRGRSTPRRPCCPAVRPAGPGRHRGARRRAVPHRRLRPAGGRGRRVHRPHGDPRRDAGGAAARRRLPHRRLRDHAGAGAVAPGRRSHRRGLARRGAGGGGGGQEPRLDPQPHRRPLGDPPGAGLGHRRGGMGGRRAGAGRRPRRG